MLSQQQHHKIDQYLMLLLAFLLPVQRRLAVICIILWAVNALVAAFPFRQFWQNWSFKPMLLFGGFYLLHWIGLLYTENMTEGWQDVETKLSLLIFPLLILRRQPMSNRLYHQVSWAFVIGCLTAVIWCLLMATWTYLDSGKNTFFYFRFSDHVRLHPTYLGLYLSFSIFILLAHWAQFRAEYSRKQLILRSGLVLCFLMIIVLLSARIILLADALLLSVVFVWWMIRNGKTWQGILSLSGAMVLGLGLISLLPVTRLRLMKVLEIFQKTPEQPQEQDIRLQLWSVGWHLIQSAPGGYGTGDIQEQLLPMYEQRQMKEAKEKNFNVHNQFLQTGIALGVVGALWLIASLFWPLWLAWKKRYFVYVMFLLLFFFCMLTESMLEKEQGVLFYAFFNSFLFQSLRVFKYKD